MFPPEHAWLGKAGIEAVLDFGGAMFATAVAIALPVTLVLLLAQIVTGVISRSAPSLNLFALGLPLGVLVGIAALIAGAPMMTDMFVDLTSAALDAAPSGGYPMSGDSQSGEKSFAPTDKRKRDAALKGDVLRSKELATAAVILVGAGAMMAGGPWMQENLAATLRAGLTWDRAALDHFDPAQAMLAALMALLPPVLVLGVLVIAASLVSQLGFGTGIWVGGNLAPKASRINPLSGLKRMFGMTGLIEMLKGLAKLGVLGVIAWTWAAGRLEMFAGLGRGTLSQQLALCWDALISLLFALGAGLVLIALIDCAGAIYPADGPAQDVVSGHARREQGGRRQPRDARLRSATASACWRAALWPRR